MVDDVPIADLLIKPFKRERFELAVDRGRQWRQRTLADGAWHAHLVRALARGIEEVRTIVAIRRARAVDDEHVLVELIGERTPDVLAHSDRVARYSVSIAQELKLDPAMIPLAGRAARLHDLGKIAMPQSLLAKPSPMTDGEIDVMRRHADAGAEILGDTTLRDLAPVVRSTHEWFGGGGYPARLAGARIPFLSRVIAVADAYDAMTQSRAYRHQLDAGEAVNELLRCSTSQFDPAVVVAFLTVLGRQ
jgi:HD-GYP domain-containing protein (c-di-GMP phosphodiesterase class II)